MSENWILECTLQFINSPMWLVPINNFVDTNCILFDAEVENKLEYTQVHQQFRDLVEGLLQTYLNELGVDVEQLLEVCQNNPDNKWVNNFLEQITYLDDYVSFRKMMVKRNVELEYEVLKAYQNVQKQQQQQQKEVPSTGQTTTTAADKSLGGDGDTQVLSPEEEEERQLQLAIEASKLESQIQLKECELEDAELQRALALSMALEEERAQKEREELLRASKDAEAEQQRKAAEKEEKERQSSAAKREIVDEREELNAKIQALEEKKELTLKKMSEETLEKRRAIAQKANDGTSNGGSRDDASSLVLTPLPEQHQVESSKTQVPPEHTTATTTSSSSSGNNKNNKVQEEGGEVKATTTAAAKKSTAPDVVHVSLTASTSSRQAPPASTGGGGDLLPEVSLGGRKGTFGMNKPLPTLSQPSFTQLRESMKPIGGASGGTTPNPTSLGENPTTTTTTAAAAAGGSKPPPVPTPTSSSSLSSAQPTEEEIRKRAEYLKQQRDLLIRDKAQQRGQQLSQYSHSQHLDTPLPPGGQPLGDSEESPGHNARIADEQHRQMTIQLARRFRGEVVGELKKSSS